VTEPWITDNTGPLEMSDAEYHADAVVGGSLSSSGARTLATSCPARYAYERQHGRPDTPTLEFGRAYHALALGVGADIVEVQAKTWTGKAAQEAAAEARAAGAIPLLTKDVTRLRAMVDALHAHPVAGPLFARPGRAEQSFFARDLDTGVMCRTRVDWMPDVADGARVLAVDLKSTADAHPDSFAGSMRKFGYHQQAAFYLDALTWLGLDNGRAPRFVFVAQEKEPPYLVTIAEPDDEAIEWGRELNRDALRTYARCTATGEWPGYDHGPTGIATLSLPGWQVAAYEAAARRELIGEPA
jgi:hypothetical protein